MTDLQYLGASVALSFVMVMLAATLKGRSWTAEGRAYAVSNREEPREVTPLTGRAERAAKNMLENLAWFAPLLIAAHLAVGDTARVRLGAMIWLVCRVIYFPLYVFGVTTIRSIVWTASLAGLGLLFSVLF
jgi:uncharacterized MAPEG superfamily protein